MRETFVASCLDETFQKNEKVLAFNYSEKNCLKPTIKTFIKKYSDTEALDDAETCRKIEDDTYNIYNIGTYKVMEVLANYAKISPWDREDAKREKRSS